MATLLTGEMFVRDAQTLIGRFESRMAAARTLLPGPAYEALVALTTRFAMPLVLQELGPLQKAYTQETLSKLPVNPEHASFLRRARLSVDIIEQGYQLVVSGEAAGATTEEVLASLVTIITSDLGKIIRASRGPAKTSVLPMVLVGGVMIALGIGVYYMLTNQDDGQLGEDLPQLGRMPGSYPLMGMRAAYAR